MFVKATIKIDTSQVPVEKVDRPDFKSLRAKIERAVGDQKWLQAFSIHETGHWIYFQRAGLKDFLYNGPRIVHDPVKDEFVAYPAALQPLTAKLDPEGFGSQRMFFNLAKAHAAGGIFSRELAGAPDHGDTDDRKRFDAICDVILQKVPAASLDRDAVWTRAQEYVKRDLRSPAFRQEAWEKAAELRQKIFKEE